MKDKIPYFFLGAIVVLLTVIITKVTDTTAQEDIVIFDKVFIRGKLVVGEGKNRITMEGAKDQASILIESEGKGILIVSQPNKSAIAITDKWADIDEFGVIISSANFDGRKDSRIRLRDSKGEKTIDTTNR